MRLLRGMAWMGNGAVPSLDSPSGPAGSPEDWATQLAHLRPAEILESIDEAFYSLDHKWRFLYANRKAMDLWRKTPDELLSQSMIQVFPEFVGSPSHRAHEEAYASGRPVRAEVISTVLNIPVEINIFPNPSGLAVYFRDVTERRKVEQALRDREQVLSLAEQSAGIGVWDAELATSKVIGTPQFYKIMGLPPSAEPTSQEVFRALRHPDDRARVVEGFNRAIAAGADVYETEYRIIRSDGEIRWIFGRGRVVRDEQGKPVRYSGVDVDITDRKRAEAELQASEQRFRLVFDMAPNAMLILAPSGRVQLVNQAARTLFGYEERELAQRSIEDLISTGEGEDRERAHIMEILQTQQGSKRREISAVTRSNALVPVEIGLNPVRMGNETAVLAAIVDVTERKRADAQRDLLLRELDHRIKNIFAVISAMISQSARHGSGDRQFAESLRQRIDALSRAHSLIHGTRAGGTITVGDVVNAVLQPHTEHAARVQVGGSATMLSADFAVALSMIAHELVTNAVKYGALSTPSGKVLVEWASAPSPEPRLRLTWREEGGPRVQPPVRTGFGSTVLTQCARGLGGEIAIDFGPDGLVATLEAPL